jgi:hypothetical protein
MFLQNGQGGDAYNQVEAVDKVIVLWNVSVELGFGQLLLLGFVADRINSLQNVRPGPGSKLATLLLNTGHLHCLGRLQRWPSPDSVNWGFAQLTAGGEDPGSAVRDLRAAMHVLAMLTAVEPALAVTLVQMRLPAAGARAVHDLLKLIAATLSLLAQLSASHQVLMDELAVIGAGQHSISI